MSLVGLRYDIATEEQVVSYPVVVKQTSKSDDHDGTEMDPKLGAIGSSICGLCKETKYTGCSGHFGVYHLAEAVLMHPVFASSILSFYNKYMCDRCMRLRNLPEVSEILEDKELSLDIKQNKILALINIDCKTCDTYVALRKYVESGSADLEVLRKVVGDSIEKTTCDKCKRLLLQLDLNDGITDKERNKMLKQALQRSAKCSNCNEQPSVLEYKDSSVIVKDASSKAAAKIAKRDGTSVVEKKKSPRNIMEEIYSIPREVFVALKLNTKLPEAFIKSSIAIPPLNIREPNSGSEDQAQHSKNKISVKIASVIDKARKYNENDPSTLHLIQVELDSLYVGRKDTKPFPRDGPDKNLYAEVNGLNKNSILKSGVFSNRVDKSTRSVAGGVEGARIGECIPSTKVFEEITIPVYFNRFSENQVSEMIRKGEAVAYIKYSPDSHVKKYSLHISPEHGWVPNLTYGSFVERKIRTGDIVLLNRNPTLHKHNIPLVQAVEPKTHSSIIQVPGPVTTVAGLDFDGDELNLIVPVGPTAPVEMVLLHAAYNLNNDTTGSPVYGINQEQIVAMSCLYRLKEMPKREVVRLLGDLANRIRDWSKETYSGDEVISLLLPETFNIKEIFPGERLTLRHFATGSAIVNVVANVYGTYEGCETVNRIYYFVQNLLKMYPIGTKTSDFYFDLDYCEEMEKYIQQCIKKFNNLIAKYYKDVDSKLIPHSVSAFTNIVLINIMKIEDMVTKLITDKVSSLPESNTLLQMWLAEYKVTSKMLKESFCCEGMLTVPKGNQPTLVPFTLDGKASPYINWDRMTAQSHGFVPSCSFGGHTLAALMMLLAYKVIPDVISTKANTSICGSHARKVYINMEPAISDNLGRLVYNGSILSPSVNGLKMMGKDICMLPLKRPEEEMTWYEHLVSRWEALVPYFRYDHNTKVMDGVAFYIDLENIIKTFVPSEDPDMTSEQCFRSVISFVEYLSERNYLGLEVKGETGPITCQEYVMLYYLDPSRTKNKLGSELLEHIYKRIQFIQIVSLAPGTEVGNRQAGNATERHTQESLSSFRSFSRVGKDVPRADFERFKKLTDMALRKPPYIIRCLAHDKKLLEPLKHIYRYTSLGNMNPFISVMEDGFTIRIEVYKVNMELESISAIDLYKMLEHYFDRRKDLKYFISMDFKEDTVVVLISITMTVSVENHFSSIEEISYIIKHVVVKGKSKKYLMDILEITMYDKDLNETPGYSITFEIKDPAELLGIDLRGITLSIPHGLLYMCRGIQACKYSLAQDFNSCYAIKTNMESMYAPCKTLASIICHDLAPTNMRNIPDKIGTVVRKGLIGYKDALRDAAIHGTCDMFKEPYARMLYGLPMNRGTTYHERFIDVNVYRNAKMPSEDVVTGEEDMELPDL